MLERTLSGLTVVTAGAKISYFNKSHKTRVSSGIFTYYTSEARRHSSQLYCMHYIAFFIGFFSLRATLSVMLYCCPAVMLSCCLAVLLYCCTAVLMSNEINHV